MAKRGPARTHAELHDPSHGFEPEDLLTFIELRPFTRRWHQLMLNDLDLLTLQMLIMTRPQGGRVIEGTGGVRKLRFAHPKWDSGKSGGLRVCYVYFEEVATVVLAAVYPKNEKDDLSASEKAAVRAVIQRVERSLMSRPYRRTPKSGAEEK